MHSADLNKNHGKLLIQFLDEFNQILEAAHSGEARFDKFIFPPVSFRQRRFEAACIFRQADFSGEVDFAGADFAEQVDFGEARFRQEANFISTTFRNEAAFFRTVFDSGTDFTGARFAKYSNFQSSKFEKMSVFAGTKFLSDTSFDGAIFSTDALFYDSAFRKNASFCLVEFQKMAVFTRARFDEGSEFTESQFAGPATFDCGIFNNIADFSSCRFNDSVTFNSCRSLAQLDFSRSTFLSRAEFRSCSFESVESINESVRFPFATFAHPEGIWFDDVSLARVSFQHCDVSKLRFSTSAQWGRRGNQCRVIFEESKEPVDFRAAAQIYQQLKQNYDDRLDYWTASEFHFREMEMKRLGTQRTGRFSGIRNWWHRNLSLVALYKWASNYGNSYRKPLAGLIAVILLCAVVFPLPWIGLKHSDPKYTETYRSVWPLNESIKQKVTAEGHVLLDSFLATLDTISFQKNAEYVPGYPWGRVVSIVGIMVASTLFALFLLAVRRQFRR